MGIFAKSAMKCGEWPMRRRVIGEREFENAVLRAQRMEIPEGSYHAAVDQGDDLPMIEKYRAALVKQLLTPAADAASVNWKRTVLAKNDYVIGHCVKKERVEKAIADDLAFLAAHPVRQSNRRSADRGWSAGADSTGSVTGSGLWGTRDG